MRAGQIDGELYLEFKRWVGVCERRSQEGLPHPEPLAVEYGIIRGHLIGLMVDQRGWKVCVRHLVTGSGTSLGGEPITGTWQQSWLPAEECRLAPISTQALDELSEAIEEDDRAAA